jgi:hypothetical protein
VIEYLQVFDHVGFLLRSVPRSWPQPAGIKRVDQPDFVQQKNLEEQESGS